MEWLRNVFLLIKYFFWRLMRMASHIVVVREEFQVDENNKVIPGTRVVRYCVKNTVENKTVKCYPTHAEAKNKCKKLNDEEDNNDDNNDSDNKSKPKFK